MNRKITPMQEKAILELAAKGLGRRVIGKELGINPNTIQGYLDRVKGKKTKSTKTTSANISKVETQPNLKTSGLNWDEALDKGAPYIIAIFKKAYDAGEIDNALAAWDRFVRSYVAKKGAIRIEQNIDARTQTVNVDITTDIVYSMLCNECKKRIEESAVKQLPTESVT